MPNKSELLVKAGLEFKRLDLSGMFQLNVSLLSKRFFRPEKSDHNGDRKKNDCGHDDFKLEVLHKK